MVVFKSILFISYLFIFLYIYSCNFSKPFSFILVLYSASPSLIVGHKFRNCFPRPKTALKHNKYHDTSIIHALLNILNSNEKFLLFVGSLFLIQFNTPRTKSFEFNEPFSDTNNLKECRVAYRLGA